MRRVGDIFERLVARDNLWAAWLDFQRGKRGRPAVQRFAPDAAAELVDLRRELREGTYRPGPYRRLLLCEPKRRLIAAAPVRDRVVHHAVHRVLAPVLDRGLIDGTFACLPGRGSHRALLAFVAALRRRRFVLHLDIRRYFLSIDRAVLIDEVMARKIKDRRTLALLRTIADSGADLYRVPGVVDFLGLEDGFPPPGCGLPIGNLTSQWWGNHYLAGFDHFALRTLKVPYYQRYMDDFVLMTDSAAQLEEARLAIAAWLAQHRRLQLKDPHAPVRPCDATLTYLGQRVSRRGVAPKRAAWRRFTRRVADLVLRGDVEAVERSVASFRGVLGLRRRG